MTRITGYNAWYTANVWPASYHHILHLFTRPFLVTVAPHLGPILSFTADEERTQGVCQSPTEKASLEDLKPEPTNGAGFYHHTYLPT